MLNLPEIYDGDELILDTETNGLSWQTCHTVGFVLRVIRGKIQQFQNYLPIRHAEGENLPVEEVLAWFATWQNKKVHIVGHNLKFDLHFFANDGILFPNATFEDTQVNAALLNENLPGGYSLDNVGKSLNIQTLKETEIYDYMAKKFGGPSDKKQMSNFWRLSAQDEMAIRYAIGDVVTTHQCSLIQREMLVEQELQKIHGVECRLIPVLFKMERRGVPVCQEKFQNLKDFVNRKLEAAMALLPADFNTRSTKMVAAVMAEKEGVAEHEMPRTLLGNLSFKEEWLKNYETGRAIINVRKLTNLQNSFIKGQIEDNLFNGRIHCNFNQMFDGNYGTQTGRLSCNGPNLQQVPKRDKLLAPIFRSIFVPEKGTVWHTNDYSQQEYRVFAAYTDSKPILDGYKNGVDIHQSVADKLGVERDPTGKRLNLGMLYWMGAAKLAESLKVTREEADKLRAWYDELFPEVKKFLKKAQGVAEKRQFVRTILGRRMRLPIRQECYRGASRVIQGTCADIVKLKMVEVNEYIERETNGEYGLILQVHDSLDWFLPEGKEYVNIEARRMMSDMSNVSNQIDDKIEMKVDSASGENWGQASFPKQDWSIYEKEVSGTELSDEVED